MNNWQGRDTQFVALVVLSCALIVASLYTFRPARQVQAVMLTASVPILYAFQGIAGVLGDGNRDFATLWNAHERNQVLMVENVRLKQAVMRLSLLKEENERLRQQLSMQAQFIGQPLAVRVLLDASGPFNHSILVSAGEEGVERGQTVVNEYGLVGRVVEVFGKRARVLLLTDSALRVPVRVVDKNVFALVGGNNDTELRVMFFKNEPKGLEDGDLVMTSGQAEVFDANIPVGVLRRQGDVWYVRPMVDFGRLDIVTVLRKKVEGVVPESTFDARFAGDPKR